MEKKKEKEKNGFGRRDKWYRSKVQKLGKKCVHKELVNCYKFYEN